MFRTAISFWVGITILCTATGSKTPGVSSGDFGLLRCVLNTYEHESANENSSWSSPQTGPQNYYPIPLLSVDVKARVTHSVAEVEVTQVYRNLEEVPIEAVYHFPVNPEGAVSGFRAEVDGRTIKGVVKTKEKAREAYDNAVRNRTSAFLGEEVKPDIFKLRVGYLRPGSQAKIVFSYVTEVKNEPGTNHIRFYIPTTVAPRYVSPSETDEAAQDLRNMTFFSTSPAPLKLDVAVVLLGEIQSITSPTHNVTVEMIRLDTRNGTLHAASVELEGVTTDMDRDFVLNIVPAEIHLPRLYSEKNENGTTAVMVHFIPYFNISEQKSELIFVLDRSGSMRGRSIELARQAMKVFLHSLPTDCYFNIIGFGSSFQFLFPNSVKYNETTLREAVNHAEGLQADLGGTEILQPLQGIYAKPGVEGYSRQIFLITDGQVSNTERVLGTIRQNAGAARVFALGIGNGASHHLVEGAAKAGGGTSAFVTNNEALNAKVVNQLKNSLMPSLSGVELKWELPSGNTSSSEEEVMWKQSPKSFPPIFNGSQLLIFGLCERGVTPKSVTIRAQSPNGPVTFRLNHSERNEIGRGVGMLHRLAAVKLIRELELEVASVKQRRWGSTNEERRLKKQIENLSIENGVTSQYTAFIAVDEDQNRSTGSNETWVMATRAVPNQIPNGSNGERDNSASIRHHMLHQMPVQSRPQLSSTGTQFLSNTMGAARDRSQQQLLELHRQMQERQLQEMAKLQRHLESVRQRQEESERQRDSELERQRIRQQLFQELERQRHSHMQMESHRDFHHQVTETFRQTPSSTPRLNFPAPESFGKIGVTQRTTSASKGPSQDFVLMELIQAQSFDGSFEINGTLAKVVGSTPEELRTDASRLNLSEKAYGTALAVREFTTRFQGDEGTWELIVRKARDWLATEVEDVDRTIEQVSNFRVNKAQ